MAERTRTRTGGPGAVPHAVRSYGRTLMERAYERAVEAGEPDPLDERVLLLGAARVLVEEMMRQGTAEAEAARLSRRERARRARAGIPPAVRVADTGAGPGAAKAAAGGGVWTGRAGRLAADTGAGERSAGRAEVIPQGGGVRSNVIPFPVARVRAARAVHETVSNA